jgi:alkanesulfonate monooxygenase SsuD/methylene tetrahydromethanopterin reductase-like flavin-dependent oxidoreductase (luciferase family)
MAYGNDNVVPSTEEALSHRYSAEERAYVEQQRARLIHGDAARVKDRLQQLSEEFGADELLAITITGDYASRLRSYQLLAEELL